jgi:hypothetical protein
LPTENLELVAQNQQLDVFHMQATAAPNQRANQRPHSEVEEGENHVADPLNPREEEATTNIGALLPPERAVLAPFSGFWYSRARVKLSLRI